MPPKKKGGKKKTQRIWITLECQNVRDGAKCGSRNYTSSKNKRNTPDRVQLKKFCRRCRAVTVHKETK
jgi:large subunit ribosomal protein L33